METTQANLATDGRVLPRQAPLTFSSGNVHSSIIITIRPDKTSAHYSSCTVCHRPMNEVLYRQPHLGEVCYIFSKQSDLRCSHSGRKSGQKSPIDLQWQNVCVFESQLSLSHTYTHTRRPFSLSLSLSLSVTPTHI